MIMNKKGKSQEFFHRIDEVCKIIKRTYLYKLVTKFLSAVCTIILIMLIIIGGMMFFFKVQSDSYSKKGMSYTAPFGLYTIISPSMEPNVSVYDVVVAVDCDISDIKVGDIVTFISTWDINYGVNVTHRVVAISKNENGEYQLTTKGDNNSTPDGSYVTQNNLIGKVVGRVPQLGQLQFFLATKMGWFMVVFIPALLIIIVDIVKIFNLYILRGKIDNVKSPKEALKEVPHEDATDKDEIKSKDKIPTIMNSQDDTIPLIDNNINNKEVDDKKDIEIPKVKDNFELPMINKNSVDNTNKHKPLERRKLEKRN